uniref:bestrophin family ion channel n=1 Tax=Spirosoma sp. TaxID=1899569 RepID=UPI003B3AC7BB
MIVKKNLTLRSIYQFAGHHILWLTVWMTLVTVLYDFTRWKWMAIPWLPISVIGTAVAFYVGFKNNQAYDRLWEGRKIWGAIINSSRMWGSMVKAYLISNDLPDDELNHLKKTLIYRHIAYIYTLRQQLLVPTQWEHVSLGWNFGTFNQLRREQLGDGAYKEELAEMDMNKYISLTEQKTNEAFANKA